MGIKYEIAKDVQNLADTLIAKYHPHLVDANIAYISDTWKKNGKTILGSAHRCSEKEKLLHGYDFIITINRDSWMLFTEDKREAVVDHELCHCGKSEDGKYILVPHDIEDFAAVIRRHGLYKEDVKHFTQVLRQVSLFDEGPGPNLRVVGSE